MRDFEVLVISYTTIGVQWLPMFNVIFSDFFLVLCYFALEMNPFLLTPASRKVTRSKLTQIEEHVWLFMPTERYVGQGIAKQQSQLTHISPCLPTCTCQITRPLGSDIDVETELVSSTILNIPVIVL